MDPTKEKSYKVEVTSHPTKDRFDFHAAPFEERLYYADIHRARQAQERAAAGLKPSFFEKFINLMDPSLKNAVVPLNDSEAHIPDEKSGMTQIQKDMENAHRMLKTSTWINSFYLITTDILGPFNAGYAFSTLGYVGGFLLYAVFGAAAIYGSFILLYMILRLDSPRLPVRNYGDVMHITMGKPMRVLAQVMQVVQLVFVVATTILATAQGLNQLSKGKLCFVAGIVIMTGTTWIVAQIRSLRIMSYVGSISVYLNIATIIISVAVICHSPPNYEGANAAYGLPIDPPAPISAVAIVGGEISNQINGAMNMVFAWGGLMIFPEMIAEMRRPMDFWKSVILSNLLIFGLYVVYGAILYSQQGQYVLPVAFQGVSIYAWQSVGNTFTLVTYSISGALYSNIAVKVVYTFLFEDIQSGAALMTWKGRIYWTILMLIYIIIAFVIGTAIPQVQTLQGLIGAAFLLQFSYLFPEMAIIGFNMKKDATAIEKPWTPEDPTLQRIDSFHQFSRWKRGFFSKSWLFNTLNLLLVLAALATAGLGIYGAAISIKATFAVSAATSFSCTPPV